MPSFKVPCPSCEARVLIKNPNLVGTKVECPKCKYRFKVEVPADELAAAGVAAPAVESEAKPDAAPADAKTDKKEKKKKDKAEKAGGKKNNKVVVGAVLGVLAVGLLGVGGYVMFGGEEKKPTPMPPGGGGPRPVQPIAQGPGGENPNGEQPGDPNDPNVPKDKDKENDKDKTPPVPKAIPLVRSDKEPTNLLPTGSVAVYRFDLDRLRQSPLGGPLFDQAMSNLFRTSLGFDPALVERYFHCSVGEKERAPFGLIRLREPMAEPVIAGAGPAQQVNGKTLRAVKGNPFLTAAGNAFAGRSLMADVYDSPATDGGKAAGASLGVCVYDSQTIMVGEYAMLRQHLALMSNGYPEFQTVYRKEEPPPPPPPAPKEGDPKDPAAAPKEPDKKEPDKKEPEKKPEPKAPDYGNKDFTSNPYYLSVSPELKKLLNTMEDVPGTAPAVVMGEKFDDAVYDRKAVKAAYKPITKVLDRVLDRTLYVGVNLTAFSPRQFTAAVRLVTRSGDDARQIAQEELTPALTEGIPLLSMLLFTNPYPNPYGIEFRSYVVPNPLAPNDPTVIIPYYPAVIAPTPGRPGDPTLPPGVVPPGTVPGQPFPPGTFPGEKEPRRPFDPTQPTDPAFVRPPVSHIDLRMTDQFVTVTVDLLWADEVYARFVAPRLFGYINQLKGKAAVYAGSSTRTALAGAVKRYVSDNKKFPAGTVPRPVGDPDRGGLPYPPVQRLSLFAELVPFIPGRQAIGGGLNRSAAWYDASKTSQNAETAGSWVPELLVSYYPPASWRATSPLAPDHTFGGTNFVAVAGVGEDAARFDPKDKDKAKLVGISGYDWGSEAAEVTDGPENTIFLLQVPPGLSRPWAAGGGATVMGLNPDKPMAAFAYDHPDGSGGTKRGTYAIMGDGAVRWIPADIDPKVFLALATRAGGEKVADLDKVAPRADQTAELKANPKAPEPKPEEPAPAPKSDATPPKAAPPAAVETAPPPRAK